MSDLRVSLACGAYDRTLPLRDGRVKPKGIDLTYMSVGPAEIFWRQMKFEEFDACEMALSSYIIELSRGIDRFVALPIFPSRVFRRSYIFVRSDAGIERPEDLKGRRVGIPEFHMTAALFIRGFLSDDYGVTAEDIDWVQGGQTKPGRKERIELNLPPSIKIRHEPHRTIEELLLAGEIDAILGAYTPQCFVDGDPRIRRLFDDPAALDREAWKRTGIFPIMHMIAIRREFHERYPWVAVNLRDAFEEARRITLEDLSDHGASSSMYPFFQWEMERTIREFGQDFWPYGVEPNRPTLEAALRYAYEQKLAARLVDIDELFPPALLQGHVD